MGQLRNKAPIVLATVLAAMAATPARPASVSMAQISTKDVEKALALNSPDNHTRYLHLHKFFELAGCNARDMEELKVPHASEPDLVCTMPGLLTPPGGSDSQRVILVARYDHVGSGAGAVENWSGAALLPLIYATVLPGYREHTMQFVATSGPEGLAAFLKTLKRQEKESTIALIDLRDVGLEATRIALLTDIAKDEGDSSMLGRGGGSARPTIATKDSMDAAQSAARSHQTFNNDAGPGSSDPRLSAMRASAAMAKTEVPHMSNPYVEGFMNAKPQTARDEAEIILQSGLPGVVIHSVTKANAAIPGSKADSLERIDQAAYYATYYYTALYVLVLDHPPAR